MNSIEVSRLISNGHRPEIPQDMPETLSNLMVKCWAESAGDRPEFSEICQILNGLYQDMVKSE